MTQEVIMSNIIKTPWVDTMSEEARREKRVREAAELDALWLELRPRAIKGMKHFTTDEFLELWHEERATGEGLEKLWAQGPIQTPV
jgi:hypothetical protein